MAYHVEGCSLCGLSRIVRESAIDPGGGEDNYFWCADVNACAERWLRKYLSGKLLWVESVQQLGSGPAQQAVFEVKYRSRDSSDSRARVLMPEVRPGRDHHRRSEHYHVIEFGEDITDQFVP